MCQRGHYPSIREVEPWNRLGSFVPLDIPHANFRLSRENIEHRTMLFRCFEFSRGGVPRCFGAISTGLVLMARYFSRVLEAER